MVTVHMPFWTWSLSFSLEFVRNVPIINGLKTKTYCKLKILQKLSASSYLCLLFLFLLFKLLRIVVIWFFSANSRCSASFINFFDCFTNAFRTSCLEKCIATFAWFCRNRNSWFAFWAIFHNCPTFDHCRKSSLAIHFWLFNTLI